MLKMPVPWTLREVLAVHFLRLLLVFLVGRMIYPLWFNAGQQLIEVTDRVIIIFLIYFTVRRHGTSLAEWGLSFARFSSDIVYGLAGGILLFVFSMLSEKVYTSCIYLVPAQHPLIVQIEKAVSWQDIVLPLLLAGVAAPVAEELLYRLFTFNALKARLGLFTGTVISAAIFALFHFNIYWLAEVFAVGIGLSLLYYWTGSLWSAIIAHSFVNTAKIIVFFLNLPLI